MSQRIEDPLFSQQETASYLRVSLQTIYLYRKRGFLNWERIAGKLIRIRKSEIDKLLGRNQNDSRDIPL